MQRNHGHCYLQDNKDRDRPIITYMSVLFTLD